jgi:hypothetical protein
LEQVGSCGDCFVYVVTERHKIACINIHDWKALATKVLNDFQTLSQAHKTIDFIKEFPKRKF